LNEHAENGSGRDVTGKSSTKESGLMRRLCICLSPVPEAAAAERELSWTELEAGGDSEGLAGLHNEGLHALDLGISRRTAYLANTIVEQLEPLRGVGNLRLHGRTLWSRTPWPDCVGFRPPTPWSDYMASANSDSMAELHDLRLYGRTAQCQRPRTPWPDCKVYSMVGSRANEQAFADTRWV
jgi:hypothetical protein